MPLLSSPSLTPTGPNGRPVSSASPLLNMSSKFQVASSKQNQLLPLATCHLPLATCHLPLATCYWLLCLLHLTEFQFDRRHASENGHPHLGHVLHQVPGLVAHLHLHEHVAREELALARALLAALHLHDLFGRHQDLTKLVLHAGIPNMFGERA